MSEADISQEEKKGKTADLSHGEDAPKKENGKEADISQNQEDGDFTKLSHMPLLNPELNPGDISSFGLAGAFALSYWDAGPEWFEKYAAWKAHRWKERKDARANKENAAKQAAKERDKELAEQLKLENIEKAIAKLEALGKKVEEGVKTAEDAAKTAEDAAKTAKGAAKTAQKTGKKMSMEEAAKQGAEGEKKAKTAAGDVKRTQGKKTKAQEERKNVSETKKRVLKLVRTSQGKRYTVAPKDKDKFNAATAAARQKAASGKGA